MIENDELARLRGGMTALKEVLAITIRASQPDPTGGTLPPKDVGGIIIRNIEPKLKSGLPGHIPNAIPGQAEFRRGYTEMLKEIRESIK